MPNDFEPQITELINEPDNVEKIRDHLAMTIKGEALNQYALALEQGVPAADDFNFRVFIENARPYDSEDDKIPLPIINVMLSKAAPMDGNSRIGNQKEKATFVIDCIACGNDAYDEWDDKAAAIRAWKAARVIRRILMSEQYAYLGLRGVVGSRVVTAIESGVPEMAGDAIAIVTARMTLEVQFIERALSIAGPIIEAINYTVDPSTGEVLSNND